MCVCLAAAVNAEANTSRERTAVELADVQKQQQPQEMVLPFAAALV
jgi:hypothetical protein